MRNRGISPSVKTLRRTLRRPLPGIDPATYLGSIPRPTWDRSRDLPGIDPATYLGSRDLPGIDPATYLGSRDLPGIDPATYLGSIPRPTWDRSHDLPGIDPATYLGSIPRPTWDPTTYLGSIPRPTWDPATYLGSRDLPGIPRPSWDPATYLGSIPRPTWDPATYLGSRALPGIPRPTWDPTTYRLPLSVQFRVVRTLLPVWLQRRLADGWSVVVLARGGPWWSWVTPAVMCAVDNVLMVSSRWHISRPRWLPHATADCVTSECVASDLSASESCVTHLELPRNKTKPTRRSDQWVAPPMWPETCLVKLKQADVSDWSVTKPKSENVCGVVNVLN